MFQLAGFLSHVADPDRWGRQNSRLELRLEMPPTRLAIARSDRDRSRAWRLGFFIDLRTARDGSETPTPGAKQWRAHSPDAFR